MEERGGRGEGGVHPVYSGMSHAPACCEYVQGVLSLLHFNAFEVCSSEAVLGQDDL